MDENKQIELTLIGRIEDNGDVRFKEFIQQLDLIKKVLLETKSIVSAKRFVAFKVVNLSHNSPASIVVEAVPLSSEDERLTQTLVDKFFSSLDDIDNDVFPSGFNYNTFEAYKKIPSLMNNNQIQEVRIFKTIDYGHYYPELKKFPEKINNIVGEDEYEISTFTGMLEAINIHRNQNVFYLYPTNGFAKVKCVFSMEPS